MGLGDKLNDTVLAWITLAITIVVGSIILLQFKSTNIGNMTCDPLYTFNASANNCYLTTNASVTTAINELGGTVDTFITGLSEPKNWVIIVIIGIIGFGVLRLFQRKSEQT